MSSSVQVPVSRVISYCSWIVFWCKRLARSWLKLQVSHRGGKYSLERMLALEDYTRTASPLRVILVCLGTPLPIITVTLVQELIPLQDPKEGSVANYGFWIRVGLLTGVVGYTAAVQAQFHVNRVTLSHLQLILIFCCVGVTFPGISMGIATAVVFPIPFILISGLPVFYTVLIASFRLIAGRQFFHDISADRSQLVRYIAFIGIEGLMIIVYPAYQTLFTAVSETQYEAAVILLLPLIKVLMKYLLSICTTHVEDLMPEAVIFTVEFVNALYVTTCVQRASAVTTIATMATVDFCQTAFGLYNLYNHTSTVLARLHESTGTRSQGNLLASIRVICHKPELWRKKAGIRVHSSIPYAQSDSSRKLIDSLTEFTNGNSAKKLVSKRISREVHHRTKNTLFNEITSIQPTVNAVVRSTRSARIQPFGAVSSAERQKVTSKLSIVHTPSHPNSFILHEALEALFTSECMILTEYLESLIPVFYGCFVLTMVRLPNIRYHMDLEGVTTGNVNPTVRNVFALALLEIISFVVLATVMKRNCGLNAIYQLAFVLETQMMLIQDKIAIWVLATLAFRVEHFGLCSKFYSLHRDFLLRLCLCLYIGVDFTFQFDWIGK